MNLIEVLACTQTALQQAGGIVDLIMPIVIVMAVVIIIWLIMELVSSVVFRKQIGDMVQATLTNVATTINVNTQYLTDSLIKLAQLGHAERLEHLRMTQMTVNEVFTTARMAVALDQLKDLIKTIESTGGS